MYRCAYEAASGAAWRLATRVAYDFGRSVRHFVFLHFVNSDGRRVHIGKFINWRVYESKVVVIVAVWTPAAVKCVGGWRFDSTGRLDDAGRLDNVGSLDDAGRLHGGGRLAGMPTCTPSALIIVAPP